MGFGLGEGVPGDWSGVWDGDRVGVALECWEVGGSYGGGEAECVW